MLHLHRLGVPPSSLRTPALRGLRCLPWDWTSWLHRPNSPFILQPHPCEHFCKDSQSYVCNSFVCQAGRFMAGLCINIYTLRQGGFGGHTHTRVFVTPSPHSGRLQLMGEWPPPRTLARPENTPRAGQATPRSHPLAQLCPAGQPCATSL